MPSAFDESKRELLRRIFGDPASNVPDFKYTATMGGYRKDEGLENLLPATLRPEEKRAALKRAIVAFLDGGRVPTVEASAGDREMRIEAATYYHFRVEVEEVRLFVKVSLDEGGDEPDASVISVKRDDRAWT